MWSVCQKGRPLARHSVSNPVGLFPQTGLTLPGIALQELGELDEAASCYEKAIALAPDYVLAHYNLAYVRQDQVCADTVPSRL